MEFYFDFGPQMLGTVAQSVGAGVRAGKVEVEDSAVAALILAAGAPSSVSLGNEKYSMSGWIVVYGACMARISRKFTGVQSELIKASNSKPSMKDLNLTTSVSFRRLAYRSCKSRDSTPTIHFL